MCMGLAACAAKPPIQEMAEARTSVQMAAQLAQHQDGKPPMLQSAEQALKKAAQAIQDKRYGYARSEALKAKYRAQRAVRNLQKSK